MVPDWIRIPMEDLTPHPMNAEVYGPDAFDIKMMESIRKHGILEPLVVTRENVIVSGHRRWAAAMRLLPAGSGLPCRVEEFEDELAEQEALVAHNLQREKTFSQRMAEGQVLDRIEYERSKRRQGARTDLPANLPEGYEPGETREKVAAKIGMGARTYGKAKRIVEAAEAGDEKALEAVKAIDAGEMSVDRAYKEVTKNLVLIQVFFPAPSDGAERSRHFDDEMPAAGERALEWIRLRESCDEPIDRILYNHTIITVQSLEALVTKAGGTLPSVKASEPEPTPTDKSARQYEIKIGYKNPDGGKGGTETFVGEMPEVGERALKSIRDVETLGGCAGKIQFNQQVVPLFELKYLIETACRQEGRLPTPAPEPEPEPEEAACDAAPGEEPAPVQKDVVIPAEVLDIGPDEQVTIGVWYQREGMPKPDYMNNRQPLAVGIISITAWMRHTEVDPGYAFPKIKVGPHEVSREVLEALRAWGRMEEEKEHTITVYYTNNRVPRVRFFDGVPIEAAARALSWLDTFDRLLTDDTTAVRRIHFADGAGSDMDISSKGLERLAMPAPVAKASGGCCPERRLGKDGRCTGCGTVLLPELQARYLHLLRDEFEATLEFSRYPYESVMIVDMGGRYAVAVVPPTGDLPEALVEHLMGEASE